MKSLETEEKNSTSLLFSFSSLLFLFSSLSLYSSSSGFQFFIYTNGVVAGTDKREARERAPLSLLLLLLLPSSSSFPPPSFLPQCPFSLTGGSASKSVCDAERAQPEDAPLQEVDVRQGGLVPPRLRHGAVAVAIEADGVGLGALERERDGRGAPLRRELFRYLDEPGGEDACFFFVCCCCWVFVWGEERERKKKKKKSEFRRRKTLSGEKPEESKIEEKQNSQSLALSPQHSGATASLPALFPIVQYALAPILCTVE